MDASAGEPPRSTPAGRRGVSAQASKDAGRRAALFERRRGGLLRRPRGGAARPRRRDAQRAHRARRGAVRGVAERRLARHEAAPAHGQVRPEVVGRGAVGVLGCLVFVKRAMRGQPAVAGAAVLRGSAGLREVRGRKEYVRAVTGGAARRRSRSQRPTIMRCTLDGALKIPGRRPPRPPGAAPRPRPSSAGSCRTVWVASRFKPTPRGLAVHATPSTRSSPTTPVATERQPNKGSWRSPRHPRRYAMAPPEPRSVVAWLDTVKRGYGKRYAKYFDELGIEDEEDVRRMRPARVDELREILAKANVKPVQLDYLADAIDACRENRRLVGRPPNSPEVLQRPRTAPTKKAPEASPHLFRPDTSAERALRNRRPQTAQPKKKDYGIEDRQLVSSRPGSAPAQSQSHSTARALIMPQPPSYWAKPSDLPSTIVGRRRRRPKSRGGTKAVNWTQREAPGRESLKRRQQTEELGRRRRLACLGSWENDPDPRAPSDERRAESRGIRKAASGSWPSTRSARRSTSGSRSPSGWTATIAPRSRIGRSSGKNRPRT